MAQLVVIVMVGFLSSNDTLEEVGYYRQTHPVKIIIDRDREIQAYECLIGVPYELRNLVGQEVFFITEKEVLGPWLVTDVEGEHHSPYMINQALIDTNCKQYTHLQGMLAW